MSNTPSDSAAADLALSNKFLECLTSSWIAQALYVFAELRIADHLASGPRSAEDLAAATGSHAPSLYRLLRALTTVEVCTQHAADGTFELTPMGSLLRTDSTDSLRSYTIWWGTNLWQVWGHLLHSIKTGESARKLLTGKDAFGHLEGDPISAATFNQALLEHTRMVARTVLKAYDFSNTKTIVDVGGGYGELVIAILMRYPHVNGTIFDLPHATVGANERIRQANLEDRCQFISGDFFKALPGSADIYVLKSILHDWSDEHCKQILGTCHTAMGRDSHLLLVERIVPGRLDNSERHRAAVRTDLTMLAAHGSKERSEAEFVALLHDSAFKLTQIIPLDGGFNIIEARPVM